MLSASKAAIAGDMDRTINSGHEAWNKAGEKMRGYIDTASESVSQAGETVTKTIRSNPVKSSAIALGVGFVIARLLRL